MTRKVPYTGTTGLVVSETWVGKFCPALILSRYNEALKDFDTAIALESNNAVIYSNRGLVNRKLERFADAIEDYTNELAHSSPTNNLKALNNRAYCYAKLGQYAEAINDYS